MEKDFFARIIRLVMKMKKDFRRCRGFTLMETLLTVTLTILIAGLVVSGVSFLTKTVTKVNNQSAEEFEIGRIQYMFSKALNKRFLDSELYEFQEEPEGLKLLFNMEPVLSYQQNTLILHQYLEEFVLNYVTDLSYKVEANVLVISLVSKNKTIKLTYQWRHS